VFEGVEGPQDAPIADGPFPLILIAHGGIRAAPNHGNWLASDLAARGFVAAVVRGPTLGPRDADIAVHEIWRRPADSARRCPRSKTIPNGPGTSITQ
jgi:predicted dienelactone hydrolase